MNKIPLPVDYGYYFDFISILANKYDRFFDDEVKNYYIECIDNLKKYIGEDKYNEVTRSNEYIHLYEVNSRLYDMVDLAKENKVKAKDVDDMVYERFLAKKAVQDKFFPEVKYGERKYGYKKN